LQPLNEKIIAFQRLVQSQCKSSFYVFKLTAKNAKKGVIVDVTKMLTFSQCLHVIRIAKQFLVA